VKAAKDRQSEAGKKHGRGKIGCGTVPQPIQGKARDKIGRALGVSGRTVEMANAVAIAAEEEPETFGAIAEEMDRTGKVKRAFDKVQEIKAGKPIRKCAPSHSHRLANGAKIARQPRP